jgi:hypothetical protein
MKAARLLRLDFERESGDKNGIPERCGIASSREWSIGSNLALIRPMITSYLSFLARMAGRGRASLMLTAVAAFVAGFIEMFPAQAQLQADNFNDGNDAGWTRYDPFAGAGANIANWSFPTGGYRIRTLAPAPMPDVLGPGRAGSVRSEVYTNFYLSVDIVNWNDGLEQAAGLLARIRTAGLGTTTGYAFTWDRGDPTNATAGDVDISVITGEDPDGVSLTGSDRLHLTPGNAYRFVFIGRGPNFEGRVYQLPETNTPVVQVTGTDITYESGTGGLVIYDNSDGGTNVCDVTFDNFLATDVEFPRLQIGHNEFNEYAVVWPAEAASYTLQSTGALGTTWTNVNSSDVVQIGDQMYYYLPAPLASAPTTFYRLTRP